MLVRTALGCDNRVKVLLENMMTDTQQECENETDEAAVRNSARPSLSIPLSGRKAKNNSQWAPVEVRI